MPESPRQALERLCHEQGEDFAGLSRLLGRNSAYIQQFLRRGTPRRLAEEDRRRLAKYFNVPESLFGGRGESSDAGGAGLVVIGRHDVRASAGPGAVPGDGGATPYLAFDPRWLKALTASPSDRLSIIRVEGDSMAPTLAAGDDILVDHADAGARLRDGIYVCRQGEALLVKRIALHPSGRKITVRSDNPAYPDWPDCGLDEIDVVGRVLWAGRRVG